MKGLIVYYSWGQNTKEVAIQLGKELGWPIMALEPKIPFTTNYDDLTEEWKKNEDQDVFVPLKEIPDISSYDTILLGSPIWWYSITPVMKTFLHATNWKGKTIYPFITDGGWEGHGLEDSKRLAKDAIVKGGANFVFSENVTNAERSKILQKFVNEIREGK